MDVGKEINSTPTGRCTRPLRWFPRISRAQQTQWGGRLLGVPWQPASVLPRAGRAQGTTPCWVTQLRDQETYITRLTVCLHIRLELQGQERKKGKAEGSGRAGEVVLLGTLSLSVPGSRWGPRKPWEGTRHGRIPGDYRHRFKRTTRTRTSSFQSVRLVSLAACSPGLGNVKPVQKEHRWQKRNFIKVWTPEPSCLQDIVSATDRPAATWDGVCWAGKQPVGWKMWVGGCLNFTAKPLSVRRSLCRWK